MLETVLKTSAVAYWNLQRTWLYASSLTYKFTVGLLQKKKNYPSFVKVGLLECSEAFNAMMSSTIDNVKSLAKKITTPVI